MIESDEDVTRPDDDDYDLLTYGEAGARLAQEINKQRRLVAELHRDPISALALVSAQARQEALIEAQTRNRKPLLADMHANGFFAKQLPT